jgi:hypothetical protein
MRSEEASQEGKEAPTGGRPRKHVLTKMHKEAEAAHVKNAAEHISHNLLGWSPTELIHVPFESQINSAISTAQGWLSGGTSAVCSEGSTIEDVGGTTIGASVVLPVGAEAKLVVATVGAALTGFGGALNLAHKFGAC